MSRRVYFSPDIHDHKQTIYHKKYTAGTKVGGNKKKITGKWSFRVPRSSGYYYSPVRFLKRVAAKVARIVRLTASNRKRSSCRVSSACLAKSRSYAETLDSQRAEAIEDCIEFLNSSSSLQRSNSVSSSC